MFLSSVILCKEAMKGSKGREEQEEGLIRFFCTRVSVYVFVYAAQIYQKLLMPINKQNRSNARKRTNERTEANRE